MAQRGQSGGGKLPLWRILRAIIVLPGTVTGLVPAILLYRYWSLQVWLERPPGIRLAGCVLGVLSLFVGIVLLAATIRLFALQGRGTLAPWDPTRRLVVAGPYRHVRNPMITGVLFVLAGEYLVFQHAPQGYWFLGFLAANALFIPLFEEPGLIRRFGAEYVEYRGHVPRWIPRLTPWTPTRSPGTDNAHAKG